MSGASGPAAAVSLPRLREHAHAFAAMGGRVALRVAARPADGSRVGRDLRLVEGRVRAWAERITRFDQGSELAALNRHSSAASTLIGPSLGDLLGRSRLAATATDGLVDVALLGERLAAEHGGFVDRRPGRWWLEPAQRRLRVRREGEVSFDLDGVGKGWIADRALALLDRYPAAMVDADGDVALRASDGIDWAVAIADPRHSTDLALLAAPLTACGPRIGIATSGTSVHRWEHDHGWAHHLIDPRTGTSAETDVVQATVVADSALAAEAMAKAVVIAGSEAGLGLLDRAGIRAGILLLRDGELIGTPSAQAWLV